MEILAYVVDLVHWRIRTMNRSAAFSFVNLTSPVLSFHFNNQRIGILFKKKNFFLLHRLLFPPERDLRWIPNINDRIPHREEEIVRDNPSSERVVTESLTVQLMGS